MQSHVFTYNNYVEKINIWGYYILCTLKDVLLLGSPQLWFCCGGLGVGSPWIAPAWFGALTSSCFNMLHAEITEVCHNKHKVCLLIIPIDMRETRLGCHTENPMCHISQNTLSATQGTLELKDHHQWSSLRPTGQVFLDSPIGYWDVLTQVPSCVRLPPAVEIITYRQQTLLWRDTWLDLLHIYYKSAECLLRVLMKGHLVNGLCP